MPGEDRPLWLLGLGNYLPPARPVHAPDAGAYRGWKRARVAEPVDHPSTMAAQALGQALTAAGVHAEHLGLVVSCGVSRDYLPSWSVSTEVMRLHGMPRSCLGLDVTIGCLGVLAGLEVVRGWLAATGGGYAAVVAAERWADTVDRGAGTDQFLWAYGDGASAAVVGLGSMTPRLAAYRGGCFSTCADLNGAILVKYGGTRFPASPAGESAHRRELQPFPKETRVAAYRGEFERLFAELEARFGVKPDWLVPTQVSPNMVSIARDAAGLEEARVCRIGDLHGHLGAADVLLGVEDLLARDRLRGNVFVAASTPYAFGAGLLQAPA